jgi:Autotransporter beta-domain
MGGAFGAGWTVEPSIRAAYVDVRLRDFADADHLFVGPHPYRTSSIRIGVRVARLISTSRAAYRPYPHGPE